MDKRRQRIADLERELHLKDERINELKDEIDEGRDLVRRMSEHAEEHDHELERFITTFGLEVTADGKYSNGEFIEDYRALVDQYEDLRLRYNKLVGSFNRNIATVNPVGRPVAASDEQQAQIVRHHKAGRSARWIAEEMTLSRRTVMTVIGKHHGVDRTSNTRRKRLGLEPKKKDWRVASMDSMPKRMTKHFEQARELRKEAKGLK
jgi:hypothetical protein